MVGPTSKIRTPLSSNSALKPPLLKGNNIGDYMGGVSQGLLRGDTRSLD